jgi:4'-phosphopantetheinyl transferase
VVTPERTHAEPCHVYWGHVGQLRPRHVRVLDASEIARREGYRRGVDRDRFTLGASLLRSVLGVHLGMLPEQVTVNRRCPRCGRPHGKPRVAGVGIEVSVAHSGDLAVVAITRAGPVGVDVEAIVAIDYRDLLETVCAPEERAQVVTDGRFYAYWTRKESVLKATGFGLAIALSELWVTPPQEPARILRAPEPVPPMVVADISPDAAYAGAVAVLTDGAVAFRTHGPHEWLQLARRNELTRPVSRATVAR